MKVTVRYFVSGNHKVVTALILIILVLVLLDLTESLPSKCRLQIFLFHFGLLSWIVLDVHWLISVPFRFHGRFLQTAVLWCTHMWQTVTAISSWEWGMLNNCHHVSWVCDIMLVKKLGQCFPWWHDLKVSHVKDAWQFSSLNFESLTS
jgi:hypothetical protein